MAEQNTKTFIITIKGGPGAYDFEAQVPEGVPVGPLSLDLSEDWLKAHKDTLKKLAAEGDATHTEIQALGQVLYDAIFSEPIKEAFDAARADGPLRLCLQIEPPELEALPWEAMHDGENWLAIQRDTPLVRRFYQGKEVQAFPALQVRGALNILFVGASPRWGGERLRIEEILDGIEVSISFRKARQDETIRFVKLLNASRSDVEKALNEEYHIICFAAHGSPKGLALDDGEGGVEEVDGEIRRAPGYEPVSMSASELADMLKEKNQPTRLVFLVACQTAAQPDAVDTLSDDVAGKPDQLRNLRGFAQELIDKTNLPAVVAMQYSFSVLHAPALTGYFFAALASSHPVDVALAEARKVLFAVKQQVGRDVIAPVMYLQTKEGLLFEKEEAPEKDLSQTGWGVIFAANADPAVRYALRELFDHRKKQATKKDSHYYREFVGKDGYRTGESKMKFLDRYGVGSTRPTPDKMPYYLLIVGDPAAIPFSFQYQLDMQYAVGRICFDTLAEYAQYARSVVQTETGDLVLPRRAVVFAPANQGDTATALSQRYLATPLVEGLKTTKPDWAVAVDQVSGEAANKARLRQLVGGDDTPSLLFTASHGVEFPLNDPRQLTHQGALLCQDWPGAGQGAVSEDHYFAADDVNLDAKLLGSIFFFWGCYGAATPKMDNFSSLAGYQNTVKQIAPRDFVARLPQQLLGHPKGGALAVIGGVERKWGHAFLGEFGGRDLDVFLYTLLRLMEEYPVGAAMEYFNKRYEALLPELISAIESSQWGDVDQHYMAQLWTAAIDARNYIIIGDPAVRLQVGDTNIVERPTIEPGLRLKPEDEALLADVGRAAVAWNESGRSEMALQHQGEKLERIAALESLLQVQDDAHHIYIQACRLRQAIRQAANTWEQDGRPAVAQVHLADQLDQIEVTGLVFEEETAKAYLQACWTTVAEQLAQQEKRCRDKEAEAKHRAETEQLEQQENQARDEETVAKHHTEAEVFQQQEQRRQLTAERIITSAYLQATAGYTSAPDHQQLSLTARGWGVIFTQDADPAIREALQPLLDRRRQQAAQQDERCFREFSGSDGYSSGEFTEDFLYRHTMDIQGAPLPGKMPYYLLIVGDPESIPYTFQYQLQAKYAVGRIHFNTVEDYAHYARSVVTAESSQVSLPHRATFFGVEHSGDRATKLSAEYLIKPLTEALAADQSKWDVQALVKDEATKARLDRLLGGDETPSLLFTASHGMEFPLNASRQLMCQGALLCQDWPGAGQPILPDFYFSADDVSEAAHLSGLITFFFADYSAGTPRLDDFAETGKAPQPIAPYAFVSRLPQRLLSHSLGGALAVIGHVERCWGYSFISPGGEERIGPFYSALKRLLDGYPVGAAMESFTQYYAALSAELGALTIEHQPISDYERAKLLTAAKDARNYIIIGDPSVCLSVVNGQENAKKL